MQKFPVFYFCGVHPVALLCILPKYIPAITTDNLYLFISFHKYEYDVVFHLRMARRGRNI
jgi:hypothetical protein